jgi:hypothetical protein
VDLVRPALLVASVLLLSTASTLIVLRLRREETHHGASTAFTVAVSLFNLLLFGFLATLVP